MLFHGGRGNNNKWEFFKEPFSHSHLQEKQFAKEEHVKASHVRGKHSDQPDHTYFCRQRITISTPKT